MANKTLTLKTKLPGNNQIIRAAKTSPQAYGAMKKEFTTLVIRELIRQKCVPPKPYEKIRINYEFYEGKDPRDPDNILAGTKFINDALTTTGIIEDDDIWHVEIGGLKFIPCGEFKVIVNWEVVE